MVIISQHLTRRSPAVQPATTPHPHPEPGPGADGAPGPHHSSSPQPAPTTAPGSTPATTTPAPPRSTSPGGGTATLLCLTAAGTDTSALLERARRLNTRTTATVQPLRPIRR